MRLANERAFTLGSFIAALIFVVTGVLWLDSLDADHMHRFGNDPSVNYFAFSRDGVFGFARQRVPYVGGNPHFKFSMPTLGWVVIFYDRVRVGEIGRRRTDFWPEVFPHDYLVFKYGEFGGTTAIVRGVSITPHQEILAIRYAPIAIIAGFVAIILPILRLMRPELKPNVPSSKCTICGYNLTGNTSGVCPECGGKIAGNRT